MLHDDLQSFLKISEFHHHHHHYQMILDNIGYSIVFMLQQRTMISLFFGLQLHHPSAEDASFIAVCWLLVTGSQEGDWIQCEVWVLWCGDATVGRNGMMCKALMAGNLVLEGLDLTSPIDKL